MSEHGQDKGSPRMGSFAQAAALGVIAGLVIGLVIGLRIRGSAAEGSPANCPPVDVSYVLFAAEDIPAGAEVAADQLVAMLMPAELIAEIMVSGADAASLPSKISGQVAKVDIPRRVVITYGQLESGDG